jgi:hypothetical protein
VGTYLSANGYQGFIYNGSNYTTISAPAPSSQTIVTGISGNTVVGSYVPNSGPPFQSFLFDGAGK